jgi:chloramphenicol O-acetyltransferase
MSYGVNSKKIMFYDTDKRHAELKIRLQHDSLKQSEFFRAVVTAYIEKDDLFSEFINEYKAKNKTQSKERIEKSKKSIEKGREIEKKFNLKEDEKENIFDLIAQEHPEL